MIGIDLIKTSRMERMIERFGNKALSRFLSPTEIALVKNYKTAAGFWAVKEACSKALGVGISAECGFHDIHITKSERGAPQLTLEDTKLHYFNIKSMACSITHDGDYAIAVVTYEKR